MEDDLDIGFEVDPPPRVPAGLYIVALHRGWKRKCFGRDKIYMLWKIVSDVNGDLTYQGALVFMACNIVLNGRKFTQGSKFFQICELAHGRPFERTDRLTLNLFKGKYFTARIKLVEKTAKNDARVPWQQYAIVDALINVSAGKSADT